MLFSLRENAHRGFLLSYRANLNQDFVDPQQTMSTAKPYIHQILHSANIIRQKIVICFSIIFVKLFGEVDEHRETFYFCSRCEQVLSNFLISEAIDRCFTKILESIENFVRNGSGWSILKIEFIDLHVGTVYREITGGCSKIQLPQELKRKKCVVSINCRDDKCFLHCVCTKLFSKNKLRNTSKKKFFTRLNTSKLSFPVALHQITPFAKQNNLIINVFGYVRKEIYPMLMMTRDAQVKTDIDLLLYKQHFFLISNFNRLLSHKKKPRQYCKLCLNGFSRKKTLTKHIAICSQNKPQKTRVPADLTLKFKNMSKSLRHPFIIYADFECLTVKIHSATPSSEHSYTEKIEKHTPISYALIALDVKSKIVFHEYFVGENVVQHFLNTLKTVSGKLIEKMKIIIPLRGGGNYNPSSCVLCGKPFSPGDVKTRHHDHYMGTGEIVGLAHQSCNLSYRSTYFIPIIIHNLKGYDSHLILKHSPADYAKQVNIIPSNTQKFISFAFDNMRFLDSLQFLDAGLDVLVQNLNKTNCEFKILKSFYEENAHLLKRKGIFPYAYFDSPNVLKEKFLPSIDAFKNTLTGETVSENDYEFAQTVYQSFQCKTFGDYLELYQNADVLLLAEVFESFRKMCLDHYKLDPAHYFTLSQLTFDAGLKYANIEIQLLGNVDQYIWLESQMRGGLCLLNTRYQKANNELVGYKPRQPKNYIIPLDAVNLYGKILCMPLPLCNFSWLSREEIETFDILNTRPDSEVGYVIEADIDYPESCMELHRDLPLAPEHLILTYEHLSPYAKDLCDKLNLRGVYPCRKLIPNFYPKRNYITHYLNLKFYVEQGLIIRKIHRIMSFTQKPFLRDYIEFNNAKRRESNNAFEKSFFKKLNNSFFGKTMENPRKKLKIKAAFEEKTCQKLLRSPELEYFEIINPNFSIYKMRKTNLILDKPIFIGFAVLELSKLHMYRLYYDNFKRFYKDKCTLMYIDTDSLYLNIESQNLYSDLKNHFCNVLDLSNFPEDHPLHSKENEGALGFLKFEEITPIFCFCGLKSKMYTFLTEKNCKKRAKGVRKQIVEKVIDFDAYKNILFGETFTHHKQVSISSKSHELYTTLENKISLSAFYDKKYLLDCCESVPYGHYSITD